MLQHNTGSAQEITIALEAQELPELAKHEDSSTCWDSPVLTFSLVIKVLSTPNPTHHAQCCPSPQRATGDTHSLPLGPVTYFNFPPKDRDFHYRVINLTHDIVLTNSDSLADFGRHR